jgi:hypothetical protein
VSPRPIRRIDAVLVGVAVHVALTFAMYGLQRLAFPVEKGAFPVWYANSETVMKAVAAVAPGFVAGSLYGRGGFGIGAVTGVSAIGVEFLIAIVGFDVPVTQFPWRIASGVTASALAAALTNGIAGMAAQALRA